MIGLGVSACLMASFKAFSQWFPPERQASLTGWIMASGGLGALAAAKPLELALAIAGWREIVLALAAATLVVAGALWWFVPDKPIAEKGAGLAEQFGGVRQIFVSRHFWRYGPLAFWLTGGFMAVQGLWATRWMNVIEQMDRAAIAARLTWISGAMLAGFLFMGFFATRLVHRGIRLENVYLAAMLAAISGLASLALFPTFAGDLLWPLLGVCFSLSNIAYSLVAQAFPPTLSGRANTALNLLAFAGAFGLQWGIGVLVDLLQVAEWTAGAAYRAAFLTLLAGQAAAFAWLVVSRKNN